MKLGFILSTNNAETNWNAFRLANLAVSKGDMVTVFLIGEGVEYNTNSFTQFDIKRQINKFLKSGNSRIIACGTCMDIREQKGSKECPAGGIKDLYELIINSDKVITF